MSSIKVNAYTVRVREKNSRREESSYLPFSELGESSDLLSAKKVLEEFVKTFEQKFKGLRSESKAMKLDSGFSFSEEANTASGFFKAGFTGEQKEIYNREELDGDAIFTVLADHVNASEYYFKLWFPDSRSTGLLLVQGTSVESAAELFKRLFHKFLNEFLQDKTVQISRFTSRETVENFIEKSKVERIVLTKNRYPKDKANQLLGQEIILSDVRLKIIIEGGNLSKENILRRIEDSTGISLGREAKFFTSQTLEDLSFGPEDEYDTSISFKDEDTKKSATVKSKSGYEILPFTYIDENLITRNPATNVPTKESLRDAVNSYFNEVVNEIVS